MKLLTVSIVSFLLIGCGQSEQEKLQSALNEVERLKMLKEKTAEILNQQEANMSVEVAKSVNYLFLQKKIENEITDQIKRIKTELSYLENWHIKEEERILQTFNNRILNPWKRELKNRESLLKALQISLSGAKTRLQQAEIRFKKELEKYNSNPKYYVKPTAPIYLIEENILRLENEITQLKKSIEQYQKNKPVMPAYEKPKKRTEEIRKLEEELRIAEEKHKSFLKEFETNRESQKTIMIKIVFDLNIIKATYDSISTLHTNTILKLSEFNQ